MYFFYGDEEYLIKKEIDKFKKQLSDYEVVYIDEEEQVFEIFSQMDSFNLFSTKQLIICKNFFLLSKEDKTKSKQIINILDKNKNSDKVFIFSLFKPKTDRFPKTNSLINYLLTNAKTKEFNKLNARQIEDFVKKFIEYKGGSISEFDLIKLLSLLPDDLAYIHKEVEKLLLFNLNITEQAIDNLITNNSIDGDFALIDAISNLDYNTIYKLYLKKLEQGMPITFMISQISSFLSVVNLFNFYEGYDLNHISQDTNIHIFRIKNAKKFLSKVSLAKNNQLIKQLADIDLKIKTGKIEEKSAFETFLLNFL
ncbi:DNA polymerase III subunit delta [Mycoplasma procyoni]|uniref:DNA polymerase III subunit delta n=1 Tax=Mycoplasma procyoni TaxID=568784 RepID=UPI00197BE036|nr:DNA polymerase III subunit delta [Mycoplasma procyoni]MBN3534632.1 DNA polymerase III subunit delta [Mycoplasma procyoni]